MSAGVARASVRVTVAGARARADLVVPLGADVRTLSEAYAEAVGLDAPLELVTVSGVLLTPQQAVDEAGIADGDLVVARDDATAATAADAAPAEPTQRPRSTARLLAVALAGASGLAAGGVLAVSGASGPVRGACLLVLLLCAVGCAVPAVSLRDGALPSRARAAASPVFGAAAGFGATYRDAPGGLLLALAVAALAAAVFAAVTRMFLDSDHDELAQVWLVVSGALAVAVTVLLLSGASAHGVWSLAFATAVVAARLLPYTVVDVPDDALLDLDRLAVTAWSARERPRRRRRRSMVRTDGVDHLVHRGHNLVAAGTVMVATIAATSGPLLLLAGIDGLRGITSAVSVGLGGVSLALVARSFRARLPRTALRLCAAWLLAVLGFVVLRSSDTTTDWAVFGGLVAVALVVTVTAVQLGRGWRSVWWARAADIAEGLGIVVVVALLPLASGFSDVVRGFVS